MITQLATFTSSIPIDIEVTVKKLDNVDTGTLEYQIATTIKEYFNNRSGKIGEDFYPADLSSKISSLDNVRNIVSITPSTSLARFSKSSRVTALS